MNFNNDFIGCRIIEPLASRCAKFRFKPLTDDIMSSRILFICREEGLNLDSEVLLTPWAFTSCAVFVKFISDLVSVVDRPLLP